MAQPSPDLSTAARRSLKARAHPLRPVVIVGSKGLTASVLNEVEVALKTHELIKVKLACDDREERASQCAALSEALAAAPVQQVGKIVVLYRRRTEITEPPPQQPGKHFAAHSPRRAPRPRPVRKSAG